MLTTANPNQRHHDFPDLSVENSLIGRYTLASGATLLTALPSGPARELIFGTDAPDQCRVTKTRDGCLELRDALWRDYGDTHTDLHDINELIRIKDRILNLCGKQLGRNAAAVILDWGCGAGHTLMQLDMWLRQENICSAKLYGFANQFHSDWHCVPENITFILDIADHLPMYFKRRSIDLIYSIAGLYYMFLPEYNDQQDDMMEYFSRHCFDGKLFKTYAHTDRHLELLSNILQSHGELLIDLPIHVIDIDYTQLHTSNRNYRAVRDPDTYGEHAFVLFPAGSEPAWHVPCPQEDCFEIDSTFF